MAWESTESTGGPGTPRSGQKGRGLPCRAPAADQGGASAGPTSSQPQPSRPPAASARLAVPLSALSPLSPASPLPCRPHLPNFLRWFLLFLVSSPQTPNHQNIPGLNPWAFLLRQFSIPSWSRPYCKDPHRLMTLKSGTPAISP